MAVLISSDLSKDIVGEPLLRGVSFKLERRDRMTIAGRNGAGKTTLLRMLSGQTGVDGGELVLEKGTRVALHDQRPPRERDVSLRDYVLSGCQEPLKLEAELARLEGLMAQGDEAAMARYAGVQARFEAAGGSPIQKISAMMYFTPWPSTKTSAVRGRSGKLHRGAVRRERAVRG